MRKWRKFLHMGIWLTGIIILNIPAFSLTIGIFYAQDHSLLFPSIYGVILNALLFYKNADLMLKLVRIDKKAFFQKSLTLFVLICLFEFLIDIAYFYFFYAELPTEIISDALVGTFLMNAIFFYAPSFLFGLSLELRKNSEAKSSEKIQIKSGNESYMVAVDELLFVESDGNYSTYHTTLKPIVIRKALSHIAEELPESFVRAHKSYLVNLNKIEKQSYKDLEIGSHKIPIGRAYREKLVTRLKEI